MVESLVASSNNSATTLEHHQVRFASKRAVDRNGRVFFWESGVYRAISPAMARVYADLIESKGFAMLVHAGLIATEIAPVRLIGFDLVLKHQRIPFTSYPTEWCGPMLKDAALLTLDMNLALMEMGYELQDAHPWNVLFDGCRPRFIDFGSIVARRSDKTWYAMQEFIGMFYNPLVLMSAGCADQARSLFVHPTWRIGKRVSKSEVSLTLLKAGKFKEFFANIFPNHPRRLSGIREALSFVRDQVSALEMPFDKTAWSDYCLEEVDVTQRDSWMVKRQSAFQAITRCAPATVLDVGANTGWFSKLAALHRSKVVATDVDETCISRLYLNREARALGILPLMMDARRPPQPYGIELRCPAATERLKCEMVIALAIIHHLVFKQKVRFEEFVSSLSALTTKWLLVEFIPREDKYVAKWYNDSFSWYTEEKFVKALKTQFRTVQKLPSNPEPRTIFLCER